MNRTNIIALVCLAPLVVVACSDGAGGHDSAAPSTCTPPSGDGTRHDTSPSADETWTAASSPHVISGRLAIPAGQTLTIEPCAIVQLEGGASVLVEGRLLAVGAAEKPIRFERADPAAAWRSIEARAGSELRFAHASIEGGGNANGGRPTEYAALDIRGDQESATQPVLFVDEVTVEGSESLGILVREGGGFAPGSKALTITGGASFPMSIWGRAAGTLPSGSYLGNSVDEIILPAIGGRDDIKEDTTLAALGVPYRIGGPTGGKSLTVAGSGSVPLLTVAAGVTLRFDKEARLAVEGASGVAAGALRVEGTADAPVVFTSAEAAPAAGDWVGVVIQGTPDPRDAITHASISHAGGESQISSYGCLSPLAGSFANKGAILIIGGETPTAFVTHTTIDNSAGDGVVRGWTGEPVDLLATNAFTNIAGCYQTYPTPTAGLCPDPAPCPK